MKYLSLLVLITCLAIQSSFAQVKKQYLDSQNTSTTVVVKENSANDLEILNSQFDINNVGMGQVIRIKTEVDKKPNTETVPMAEVPNVILAQAEVPIVEEPATPKKVIEKKAVETPKVSTTKTKVRKKATTVHYSGIGKAKKVKTKRKKLKKRKFKKRKRRRSSCPRF